METRHRPTARSKIPSRIRTASVPRPVMSKSVEFSPEVQENDIKRVRRKWKSFNLGSNCLNNNVINNNTVDILTEWREELADEQNIQSLLQLASDLVAFQGQNLGPEEIQYRQEQALYWLCKASERGSKDARNLVTTMLEKGDTLLIRFLLTPLTV